MVTESAHPETDLFTVVDSYARRICPAVLNQHSEDSVSSPLGMWLLLAACATESSGAERVTLERALGCTASKAADLLAEFLEVPPTALRSAMALWVNSVDRSTPLVEWTASLSCVDRAQAASFQVDADAWINRQTEGLIARFPFTLSADFRLVLVSALASKVSWEIPFHVDAALANLRNRVHGAAKSTRSWWTTYRVP